MPCLHLAEDWIDDDEYNQHKLLLGLGCLLLAIGGPLIGLSGKKVDKGETHTGTVKHCRAANPMTPTVGWPRSQTLALPGVCC